MLGIERFELGAMTSAFRSLLLWGLQWMYVRWPAERPPSITL